MAQLKTYRVNEIVRSIQGEGCRTGIPTTFLRFSGCNMACSFCDTDHESGQDMTLPEICEALWWIGCDVVSLCGGEPALQVDEELLAALRRLGSLVTIETNGTRRLPWGIDYVVVSPKVSPTELFASFSGRLIDELKYVRRAGQSLPTIPSGVAASHYLLTPEYDGDTIVPENVVWCADLVAANPPWRLNLQAHKAWGIV